MSNQNPIHRDRGRRDNIRSNRVGDKEAFSENEARLEHEASVPPSEGAELTDEQQTELQEQAAERRFEDIARDDAGDEKSSD